MTKLQQHPSSQRLAGKIALVTGAARGIGQGIALCLAEEGADIVINDLPQQAVLAQETVREIEALGRRALFGPADVTDRQQVTAMFQMALQHFGRLDIAVANAAYSDRQLVVEADWAGVLRTIEVTQFGVFHICQLAAQHMAQRGQGGKIIITASVLAEIPHKTSSAYNMSKAAVTQFGRTLAHELLPHRINVNLINPGWIDTPGERKFTNEADIQRSASKLPWGRLGQPRDIGRAAVYLASDDADYVTGSTITVDGGYRIGMQMVLA
ncbi:MAG: SDR family oxidoreductase [Anaerolineae bacterium]|nr:SDR family oxidoreductase [Anaerolineae bacterium]